MKLEYEKGNIVTGNYPVFCHQVNCKGVMGAGLAKQIRDLFPFVYTEYKELCNTEPNLLGHILLSHSSGLNGRICVSMFAQDNYGRNKRYTDYTAFKQCLDTLAKHMNNYSTEGYYNTIAFPYGIGCGLAGGDWVIIQGMLEDFAKKVKQRVVIVSLN